MPVPYRRRLARPAPTLATAGLALMALHQDARAADPIVGADNNNAGNAFVQPQDPAQAGGGRNQSLRNGDVLQGTPRADLLIGGLGVDVILADRGPDVMIGGLEHFTEGAIGNANDRAFGDQGADIFIWKPGDGSDFFDGGRGIDVVVFGVVAEPDADTPELPVFEVLNDGLGGVTFIDPDTGLPLVEVTNSPGFCPVIDASTSPDAAEQLDALGIDHLVQFVLRGVRQAFDAGDQDEDNGLRVTLHLKDVEFLVCTVEEGGAIEVLDLRDSPPTLTSIDELPRARLRRNLDDMVL